MFVWFLVNSAPAFSYWFRTGLVMYSHLKICIYLRFYYLWSISFKYWNWWGLFKNSLFLITGTGKPLKFKSRKSKMLGNSNYFWFCFLPPCPPLDLLLGTARSLLFFVCALKIEFQFAPPWRLLCPTILVVLPQHLSIVLCGSSAVTALLSFLFWAIVSSYYC